MRRAIGRGGSLFAAALLAITSCFLPVSAAEKQKGPAEVKSAAVTGFLPETLNLEFADSNWMNQISQVTVNGSKYSKGTISWGTSGKVWQLADVVGAYGSYRALKLVNPEYPAKIQIEAEGYKPITVRVEKNAAVYPYTYKATIEKNNPGGQTDPSGADNPGGQTDPSGTGDPGSGNTSPGKIRLSQLKLSQDSWGSLWKIGITGADSYVSKVKEVLVNKKTWSEVPYNPSSGGKYQKKTDSNQLLFASKDFSAAQTVPILKSGDSICIKADGYEDLTFKFVVDTDGKASLVADDNGGDPYELKVKLEGSFEAAIKGQKNYDGVTSASLSGASSNKNSRVKVYGALVKKGQEPTEKDWEELDHQSKIRLDPNRCKVDLVPDTAKGTPAGNRSGMEGRYLTLSSSLTLSGTPKDPGHYLVSVSVADQQGRTASSNSLPFTIYSGQEKLADRLKPENLKKYASGHMAWDIMEPWAIREFGSNVPGEDNAVRVPADLEAWFGSHESGTYGVLGYDIAWSDVEKGRIPQTLYIPKGCNLTIKNMKILSSVRIVVEKGGKLNLLDSSVQGIIDVRDGGSFSMNYDSFAGRFMTGASICGQLRLADGAIVENAAIYSHANYLANGQRTDRTTSEPVVTASGKVTVKGQVFIKGDDAGRDIGQTALRVNGQLQLEDGALLAAFGGPGKVLLDREGGTAIELEKESKITGKGKVVAVGGDVLWGTGGSAVTGQGSIETEEAFLQGANASKLRNATPGKALGEKIRLTSPGQYLADGVQSEAIGADDPLKDLYWRTGIDPKPPIEKYRTKPVKPDDPGKDDPGKTDPDKTDPGKDDPGKDDPGKTDPAKKDPGAKDGSSSLKQKESGQIGGSSQSAAGQGTVKSKAPRTADRRLPWAELAAALLLGTALTGVRLAIIRGGKAKRKE